MALRKVRPNLSEVVGRRKFPSCIYDTLKINGNSSSVEGFDVEVCSDDLPLSLYDVLVVGTGEPRYYCDSYYLKGIGVDGSFHFHRVHDNRVVCPICGPHVVSQKIYDTAVRLVTFNDIHPGLRLYSAVFKFVPSCGYISRNDIARFLESVSDFLHSVGVTQFVKIPSLISLKPDMVFPLRCYLRAHSDVVSTRVCVDSAAPYSPSSAVSYVRGSSSIDVHLRSLTFDPCVWSFFGVHDWRDFYDFTPMVQVVFFSSGDSPVYDGLEYGDFRVDCCACISDGSLIDSLVDVLHLYFGRVCQFMESSGVKPLQSVSWSGGLRGVNNPLKSYETGYVDPVCSQFVLLAMYDNGLDVGRLRVSFFKPHCVDGRTVYDRFPDFESLCPSDIVPWGRFIIRREPNGRLNVDDVVFIRKFLNNLVNPVDRRHVSYVIHLLNERKYDPCVRIKSLTRDEILKIGDKYISHPAGVYYESKRDASWVDFLNLRGKCRLVAPSTASVQCVQSVLSAYV